MAKETLAAIRYIFQHAAEFNYPLLIMHGTGDRLVYARGSQEFAELAKTADVTLHLWEGAYHELVNEPEQDQVFNKILQWLTTQLT
jgi:alpha-beta hydrolase superfamily lysophospholipase